MARVGVIGGSGLYEMEGLVNVQEVRVETPFGAPSDALVTGTLDGVDLVFLPRHARGHRLNPSEIPFRANIWALKSLGVDWIVSLSAVGSLREEIVPGQVVLVDQFVDRTFRRASTFFEGGVVAHVAFGDPVCEVLRGYLLQAARSVGAVVHDRGTYVCMEGPQFSTRAESELHRSWGASVIGMTNMPEAKLAREAEISYATVAFATDYDCWHAGHEAVTVEQVIAVIHRNVDLGKRIVRAVTPLIAAHPGPAPHHDALRNAIMTNPSAIDPRARERLSLLLDKHLPR